MPFIKNRTGASLSAITAIMGLIFSATVMPVSGDTTRSFAGGPAATSQSRFANDLPIRHFLAREAICSFDSSITVINLTPQQ